MPARLQVGVEVQNRSAVGAKGGGFSEAFFGLFGPPWQHFDPRWDECANNLTDVLMEGFVK
jgi:hypothetical protein